MELLAIILQLIILIVGFWFSLKFFLAGLCIFFSDKELYEENRKVSILCKKYGKGQLSESEMKDFQNFRALGYVTTRMVTNTRTKTIEVSAKLSDEALNRVFESGRFKLLRILTFNILK